MKFIFKQIQDLNKYGIIILPKKFFIFIKLMLKLPVYFICLPILFFIYLIGHFYVVRFKSLGVNFGLLSLVPELYCCGVDQKIDIPKKPFIDMKIHDAIENTFALMRNINAYLEIKAPWKTIKENHAQKSNAATTLALSADVLRICSQLLYPVMPTKTNSIIKILGAKNISISDTNLGKLNAGISLGEGKSPFPRITNK